MTAQGSNRCRSRRSRGWFESAFGSISGTGTNDNWKTTNTLKFGDLAPEETKFEGMKGWPDASNKYIKGKVISSDRQGNIYKSLFIDDGTAGIELKLYNGLYLDYYLNLATMESQWVYVRLDGLFLGNYRMMPLDRRRPVGFEQRRGQAQVLCELEPSTIRTLPSSMCCRASGRRSIRRTSPRWIPQTYTSLSKDHFGRLVRFKDVKVRYAGVPNQDHVVKDAMKNGGNTNIYPSWIVTDTGIPQNAPWYYMAYNIENIRLYGSLLISYNDAAEYTSDPGIYSVRTSGYSQFAMRPVPKDGAVGTVLGIYAIYSKKSTFTGRRERLGRSIRFRSAGSRIWTSTRRIC